LVKRHWKHRVVIIIKEGFQMSRNTNAADAENSNMIKDPDEWKTGDEEITGAQRSYLQTLADEAGEDVDLDLTKAEASKKIDELQQKTGRGVD
jgi:hypothetical protein